MTPNSLSTPRVANFVAICVRNASVGTITNTLLQGLEMNTESIVSVSPVPVGITTMPIWPALVCTLLCQAFILNELFHESHREQEDAVSDWTHSWQIPTKMVL